MANYTTDIVLGERYRDTQTGIEGVATSVHFYQYACERVTLEVLNKDGEINEYAFDAPRVVSVSSGVVPEVTKTGGPGGVHESRLRQDTGRR